MKKTLHILSCAAVAIVALASCTKEQFKENVIPSGEKIQVSVNGQIGDFIPADATKADAANVVRITWAADDQVYVYDGSDASIGTLTVNPDPNNASQALLSGEIKGSKASPSKLTLVYVKGETEAPAIAEGKISIELSNQNKKDVPFVLYSTIAYDADALTKKNEYIPFKFATSVMTVNCTGLSTNEGTKIDITKAEIDGVSTVCELSVTGDGVTVTGASKGTITRTETAEHSVFTQLDSRGSFILALAADPETPAARNILVYQDSKVYGAPFTSTTLAGNKSYNTVYELGEYVLSIPDGFVDLGVTTTDGKPLYWKKCNLGASNPWEYGKYFQWGDITGRVCNGTKDGSTFEGSYNFKWSSAPFHTGDSQSINWTKYIPTEKSSFWSGEGNPDNKTVLESTDDAAYKASNGAWCMPTKEDFAGLFSTCYTEWGAYNGVNGLIVYKAKEGDAGYAYFDSKMNQYSGSENSWNATEKTRPGYSTASDTFVFFPAAGYGYNAALSNAGSHCRYWSSSLNSSNPSSAYSLLFNGTDISPQGSIFRYSGYSVRPVTTAAPKPAVKVEGVSLASKDTVEVGASKTLVATVTPANATHKEVTWSSSDEAVATINATTGVVTGVAAGSAVITATTADGNFTAVCLVTVTPPNPLYVEIAAMYDGSNITTLKWYRQNLAISDSGKKAWKGSNSSAVKVPGTEKDVIVGDYFQWAAYEGYSSTSKSEHKGLLLYTSFDNNKCVDDEDKSNNFYTDGGVFSKSFNSSSAPYGGTSYSKYNTSSPDILERTETVNDDVASIILGGTWRMPKWAEFNAMKAATYWAWDATDMGYYVFFPDATYKAGERANSVPVDLNKADALLFFPAAGYGSSGLYNVGQLGRYWSSSLDTGDTGKAYSLSFLFNDVFPQGSFIFSRYLGYSVRPVSN